ncbi:MAG: hypothetical protein JNM27_01165 [Leptospirales bacterium]|nr:hypothetical protein [Leptospirales bacterium]
MRILSQLSLILLFTGCASVFSPREYPIYLDSQIDGVSVSLFCPRRLPESLGTTPLTFYWTPEESCFVEFQKEGYQSKRLPVKTTVNPVAVGNCGSPGYLFWPVDLYTGRYLRPSDPAMRASLEEATRFNPADDSK